MENMTMKKVYSKPKVFFVDFSLANSVASTCTNAVNSSDVNTCEYQEDSYFHFTESNLDCEIFHEEKDYCYHVPTGDTGVFSS